MEFLKYGKIRLIGHEENETLLIDPEDEIVIQEKMDGANGRFCISDGTLIFGSRNNILIDSDNGGSASVWLRFIRHIRAAFDGKDLNVVIGDRSLIFYGEVMHKHSISYEWDRTPVFLGYDIFDIATGKYLNYPEVVDIYNGLGIETVPLRGVYKVKDLPKLDETIIPPSKYYNGLAEGVVIKNYSKQVFGKLVREKFKEVNKEAFGKPAKFAADDTEKILCKYCTNARIDKNIFKLVDDGKRLGMELMIDLPKRVWEDIVVEEGVEILNTRGVIDLTQLRKDISKRCAEVLKTTIVNSALA